MDFSNDLSLRHGVFNNYYKRHQQKVKLYVSLYVLVVYIGSACVLSRTCVLPNGNIKNHHQQSLTSRNIQNYFSRNATSKRYIFCLVPTKEVMFFNRGHAFVHKQWETVMNWFNLMKFGAILDFGLCIVQICDGNRMHEILHESSPLSKACHQLYPNRKCWMSITSVA